MKPQSLIILALSGLVAATIPDLPSCAKECLDKYKSDSQIAGCKSLDIACICKNDSFLSGVVCCLNDACPGSDDRARAVSVARQTCMAAGVSTPANVVCNKAGAQTAAYLAPTGGRGGNSTVSSVWPRPSASGTTSRSGTGPTETPIEGHGPRTVAMGSTGVLVGAVLAAVAIL